MRAGGLASGDQSEARETARKALKLYDEGRGQTHHAMSKRFLDSQWTGLDDGDEVPLRPLVERLAAGEVMDVWPVEDQQLIGYWLCRFRHAPSLIYVNVGYAHVSFVQKNVKHHGGLCGHNFVET